MLTSSEFASRIKKQYPQYREVPDDRLVTAMMQKYPQLAGKVLPPVQIAVPTGWQGPAPSRPLSEIAGGRKLMELKEQPRRGAAEAVADFASLSNIPVLGDFIDAGRTVKQISTLRRLNKGQAVSDEELVDLNTWLTVQERMQESTFAAKVLDTAATAAKFSAEIGIAKATFGGSYAVKGVSKSSAAAAAVAKKKFLAGAVKKKGVRGLAQGIRANMAGAGAMEREFLTLAAKKARVVLDSAGATRLLGDRVAAKSAKVMAYGAMSGLTGLALTPNPVMWGKTLSAAQRHRLDKAMQGEEGEMGVDALLAGFTDTAIELTSAGIGRGVAEAMTIPFANRFGDATRAALHGWGTTVKDIITRNSPDAVNTVARTAGGFIHKVLMRKGLQEGSAAASMDRLMRTVGIDNVIEEMLEERTVDFLRGLTGLDGDDWGFRAGIRNVIRRVSDLEQMGVEAVAFAIPGGLIGQAHRLRIAATDIVAPTQVRKQTKAEVKTMNTEWRRMMETTAATGLDQQWDAPLVKAMPAESVTAMKEAKSPAQLKEALSEALDKTDKPVVRDYIQERIDAIDAAYILDGYDMWKEFGVNNPKSAFMHTIGMAGAVQAFASAETSMIIGYEDQYRQDAFNRAFIAAQQYNAADPLVASEVAHRIVSRLFPAAPEAAAPAPAPDAPPAEPTGFVARTEGMEPADRGDAEVPPPPVAPDAPAPAPEKKMTKLDTAAEKARVRMDKARKITELRDSFPELAEDQIETILAERESLVTDRIVLSEAEGGGVPEGGFPMWGQSLLRKFSSLAPIRRVATGPAADDITAPKIMQAFKGVVFTPESLLGHVKQVTNEAQAEGIVGAVIGAEGRIRGDALRWWDANEGLRPFLVALTGRARAVDTVHEMLHVMLPLLPYDRMAGIAAYLNRAHNTEINLDNVRDPREWRKHTVLVGGQGLTAEELFVRIGLVLFADMNAAEGETRDRLDTHRKNLGVPAALADMIREMMAPFARGIPEPKYSEGRIPQKADLQGNQTRLFESQIARALEEAFMSTAEGEGASTVTAEEIQDMARMELELAQRIMEQLNREDAAPLLQSFLPKTMSKAQKDAADLTDIAEQTARNMARMWSVASLNLANMYRRDEADYRGNIQTLVEAVVSGGLYMSESTTLRTKDKATSRRSINRKLILAPAEAAYPKRVEDELERRKENVRSGRREAADDGGNPLTRSELEELENRYPRYMDYLLHNTDYIQHQAMTFLSAFHSFKRQSDGTRMLMTSAAFAMMPEAQQTALAAEMVEGFRRWLSGENSFRVLMHKMTTMLRSELVSDALIFEPGDRIDIPTSPLPPLPRTKAQKKASKKKPTRETEAIKPVERPEPDARPKQDDETVVTALSELIIPSAVDKTKALKSAIDALGDPGKNLILAAGTLDSRLKQVNEILSFNDSDAVVGWRQDLDRAVASFRKQAEDAISQDAVDKILVAALDDTAELVRTGEFADTALGKNILTVIQRRINDIIQPDTRKATQVEPVAEAETESTPQKESIDPDVTVSRTADGGVELDMTERKTGTRRMFTDILDLVSPETRSDEAVAGYEVLRESDDYALRGLANDAISLRKHLRGAHGAIRTGGLEGATAWAADIRSMVDNFLEGAEGLLSDGEARIIAAQALSETADHIASGEFAKTPEGKKLTRQLRTVGAKMTKADARGQEPAAVPETTVAAEPLIIVSSKNVRTPGEPHTRVTLSNGIEVTIFRDPADKGWHLDLYDFNPNPAPSQIGHVFSAIGGTKKEALATVAERVETAIKTLGLRGQEPEGAFSRVQGEETAENIEDTVVRDLREQAVALLNESAEAEGAFSRLPRELQGRSAQQIANKGSVAPLSPGALDVINSTYTEQHRGDVMALAEDAMNQVLDEVAPGNAAISDDVRAYEEVYARFFSPESVSDQDVQVLTAMVQPFLARTGALYFNPETSSKDKNTLDALQARVATWFIDVQRKSGRIVDLGRLLSTLIPASSVALTGMLKDAGNRYFAVNKDMHQMFNAGTQIAVARLSSEERAAITRAALEQPELTRNLMEMVQKDPRKFRSFVRAVDYQSKKAEIAEIRKAGEQKTAAGEFDRSNTGKGVTSLVTDNAMAAVHANLYSGDLSNRIDNLLTAVGAFASVAAPPTSPRGDFLRKEVESYIKTLLAEDIGDPDALTEFRNARLDVIRNLYGTHNSWTDLGEQGWAAVGQLMRDAETQAMDSLFRTTLAWMGAMNIDMSHLADMFQDDVKLSEIVTKLTKVNEAVSDTADDLAHGLEDQEAAADILTTAAGLSDADAEKFRAEAARMAAEIEDLKQRLFRASEDAVAAQEELVAHLTGSDVTAARDALKVIMGQTFSEDAGVALAESGLARLTWSERFASAAYRADIDGESAVGKLVNSIKSSLRKPKEQTPTDQAVRTLTRAIRALLPEKNRAETMSIYQAVMQAAENPDTFNDIIQMSIKSIAMAEPWAQDIYTALDELAGTMVTAQQLAEYIGDEGAKASWLKLAGLIDMMDVRFGLTETGEIRLAPGQETGKVLIPDAVVNNMINRFMRDNGETLAHVLDHGLTGQNLQVESLTEAMMLGMQHQSIDWTMDAASTRILAGRISRVLMERVNRLKVGKLEQFVKGGEQARQIQQKKDAGGWERRMLQMIYLGALDTGLGAAGQQQKWQDEFAIRFRIPSINPELRDKLNQYAVEFSRRSMDAYKAMQDVLMPPVEGDQTPGEKMLDALTRRHRDEEMHQLYLHSEAHRQFMADMHRTIQLSQGVGFGDMAIALFYSNALSGFSTQELNFFATFFNTAFVLHNDGLAEVMNHIRDGKDTRTAWVSYFEGFRQAFNGWITGLKTFGPMILKENRFPGAHVVSNQMLGRNMPTTLELKPFQDKWGPGLIPRALDAMRYVMRVMMTSDFAHSRAAGQGTMWRMLFLDGLKRGMTEDAARTWAAVNTFGSLDYDMTRVEDRYRAEQDIKKLELSDANRELFNTRLVHADGAHTVARVKGLKPGSFDYNVLVEETLYNMLPSVMQEDQDGAASDLYQALGKSAESRSIRDQVRLMAGRATWNVMDIDPLFAPEHRRLAAVGKAAVQFKAKHPTLGMFLFPFISIITNVVNSGLDTTPGFSHLHLREARKQIGTEGGADFAYRTQDIEYLQAQALTGSILFAGLGMLFGMAYASDPDDPPFEITGRGPSDARLKNQLRETGYQEYTIKFGRTRYNYHMSPLAVPLSILGSWMDSVRYDDPTGEKASIPLALATVRATRAIMEQTYMSGVSDLFSALTTPNVEVGEDKLKSMFVRTTSTIVVPNMLRQVSRLFDDRLLDAPDGIIATYMREIPLPIPSKEVRLNALGEDIHLGQSSMITSLVKAPTGEFGRFGRMLNFNTQPADSIWSYVARNRLLIPTVSRNTMLQGVAMDNDQLRTYARARGRILKSWISERMSSGAWAGLGREERQADLQHLSRRAGIIVRGEMAVPGLAPGMTAHPAPGLADRITREREALMMAGL
jgi:hypothetical protein